eukprot:6213615-Pleurochrysis_carterae.AAC.3
MWRFGSLGGFARNREFRQLAREDGSLGPLGGLSAKNWVFRSGREDSEESGVQAARGDGSLGHWADLLLRIGCLGHGVKIRKFRSCGESGVLIRLLARGDGSLGPLGRLSAKNRVFRSGCEELKV